MSEDFQEALKYFRKLGCLARQPEVATMLDVTLASVDQGLLLCWEEKVKMGENCTLILQYSGGKVTTSLKSSKSVEISKSPTEVKIKRKPKNKTWRNYSSTTYIWSKKKGYHQADK